MRLAVLTALMHCRAISCWLRGLVGRDGSRPGWWCGLAVELTALILAAPGLVMLAKRVPVGGTIRTRTSAGIPGTLPSSGERSGVARCPCICICILASPRALASALTGVLTTRAVGAQLLPFSPMRGG